MLLKVLLDAEVRLGELFKKIPKNSGGDRRNEIFKRDTRQKALLDAEVKLGELFSALPKATAKNNPSGMKKSTQRDSPVTLGTQFRGGAKLGYQKAKNKYAEIDSAVHFSTMKPKTTI